MAASAYFLVFLFCGCFCVRCLLPALRATARVWLGLCAGIFLLMWLPVISAFLFRFSLTAHLVALGLLFAVTALCYFARDKKTSVRAFDEGEKKTLLALLCVCLPLTLVGGYLQWTHNIEYGAAGGLYTGQSTYGDLPLHLSIITSLRDASFPPDYSIFPGNRLCYPFLTDSLSTSFMVLGCDLRTAILIPGITMLTLVFFGYGMLASRMTTKKRAAGLAVLFFFLNGGLGFMYMLDMAGVSVGTAGSNELQAGTWLDRIKTVLNGWYLTPANNAEFTTYNLRWSNVIADMLIPQRTTLGGWCLLLPCLYLLYDGMTEKKTGARHYLVLGVMAGGLPMVHTHSFLALGLCSAGFMGCDLLKKDKERTFLQRLRPWALYGCTALVLALPQLLLWTFSQVKENNNFLIFQFNWVNNSGGNGLRDAYFWFYLKNIGVPFILLILSLFDKNKNRRLLTIGAFCIFLPAEFILFQPNEYDNNKLFYVWYMLICVVAADYAVSVFDRLRGRPVRYLLAAVCVTAGVLSGSLSIARECVSDYRMFSENDVQAAEYIEENTEKDSVFLTYTQHINPVSSLAGRKIVCGPSLWLYWHGYDITPRENDIVAFLRDPDANGDVLEKYNVSYIMISSYERQQGADTDVFDSLYPRVYSDAYGDIVIYRAERSDK